MPIASMRRPLPSRARFSRLLLALLAVTGSVLVPADTAAFAAWNSVPCRWIYDSGEGGQVWSCYADGWRFMPESDNPALNGLTVTIPATGHYMYAVVVSPDWSVYEYVGGPEGRSDWDWGVESYSLPADATGWQVGLIDYGPIGWDGVSAFTPITPRTTAFPWVLEAKPDAHTTSVVSTIVDPLLSFTVTNRSGACNGVTPTGSATGSAAQLGRVSASAPVSAAQDLTVASNAGDGFAVYVSGGPLSGARALADVTGTNASPAAFGAGERFGYTIDDADVAGFSGPLFAALSTTDAPIMTYLAGVAPAAVTNCIAYQLAVTSSTPAGFYSTTVSYTVVPSF